MGTDGIDVGSKAREIRGMLGMGGTRWKKKLSSNFELA